MQFHVQPVPTSIRKKHSPFSGVEEEAELGKNMFCYDEENTELFPEGNKIANFMV